MSALAKQITDRSISKGQRETNTIIHGYRIEPLNLGSGSYSVVRQATELSSGASVACKQMHHRLRSASECLTREVTALRTVHDAVAHPNIVQLRALHYDRDYAYLFLSSLRGAVTLRVYLDDHVMRHTPITEHVIRHVIQSIVTAVHHCHRQGVSHRDLKLENILIVPHSQQVLLIDFGLALTHPPGTSPIVQEWQGSPLYMSPEVLSCRAHSPYAADVWSIGVVAHLLLFGQYPFVADSLDDLVLAVTRTRYCCPATRAESLQVSPLLSDLLSRLLEPDPSARLTTEQLLQHPWLAHHTPS